MNSQHIIPVLFLAATAMTALGLGGCALADKTGDSLQRYWAEETGMVPGPAKPKKNLEMTSSNPKDYILADGTGVAIPAKERYDLYISPFAPHGYVLSKAKEGSRVVCPYSGRILILGERDYVAEKELY